MRIYWKDVVARQIEAIRKQELLTLLDEYKGQQFGIVSAYQEATRQENKANHGELLADIARLGYSWKERMKSSWTDSSGKPILEQSVMVPGMSAEETFALGRKYKQAAVIWKDPRSICSCYFLQEHQAAVALDPRSGNITFDWSLRKDLYSKTRGLSFEFKFLWDQKIPWDGRNPISPQRIKDLLAEGYFTPA